VVTTVARSRAKLQSNHHHQQQPQKPNFFTGRMSFLSPNQQCQSTEGKNCILVMYNNHRSCEDCNIMQR